MLRRGFHLGAIGQNATIASSQRHDQSITLGDTFPGNHSNDRRCPTTGGQTTTSDDGQSGPAATVATGIQSPGSRWEKPQCALFERAFRVVGRKRINAATHQIQKRQSSSTAAAPSSLCRQWSWRRLCRRRPSSVARILGTTAATVSAVSTSLGTGALLELSRGQSRGTTNVGLSSTAT